VDIFGAVQGLLRPKVPIPCLLACPGSILLISSSEVRDNLKGQISFVAVGAEEARLVLHRFTGARAGEGFGGRCVFRPAMV
jgi:hypothetical protein